MKHHYNDIRDRIAEAPKWHDEAGVPRYCEFSPDETSNIYANEVALLEIACQPCGRRFLVAMSWNQTDWIIRKAPRLSERVIAQTIHYGDPPNVSCCVAGATMNSIPLRVVEFWRKDHIDWERVAGLERPIEADWVGGANEQEA